MCTMTRTSHTLQGHLPRIHAPTSRMDASLPELPLDLAACHDLIRQLQAELQRAAEQLAACESQARQAEGNVAHLEALLAEYRETITTSEETIAQLTADNQLLECCLFGLRRERYTDAPNQTLLFPAAPLTPAMPEGDAREHPKPTASCCGG